jgi:hypothetical protein
MKKPNRLIAHELAVQANEKYAQALKTEEAKLEIDRRKNIIREKISLPVAFFTLFLYAGLVISDAIIMAPILKVFTVESMSISQSMVPLVVAVYVILATAFAFFIARGFLRAISAPAREMDLEFAKLAAPDKVSSSLTRETQQSGRREFRLSLAMFLGFMFLVVIPLCLTRNYYNASHPLRIKLSSPSDWTSMIIPVVTAIIMFMVSIYKEVVLKFLNFAWKSSSMGSAVKRLFDEAQSLGVEAIEYDFAAIEAYEGTEQSKELKEVRARYSGVSTLSKRQRTVMVKVQRQGLPVPHMQVQGMTPYDEIIFSTTGTDGTTWLSWNNGDYLKKIIVDRFPLNGQKFDNGQTVVVEMDFISSNDQHLKLA